MAGLALRLGLCTNPDCPVCTVTDYPRFLSPYHVVSTSERESAVRPHLEPGSWSAMARQGTWVPKGVQRWLRAIAAQAIEIVTGDDVPRIVVKCGQGRRPGVVRLIVPGAAPPSSIVASDLWKSTADATVLE